MEASVCVCVCACVCVCIRVCVRVRMRADTSIKDDKEALRLLIRWRGGYRDMPPLSYSPD